MVIKSPGDCKDENGEKGRCVAGAINNYTSQLLSYNSHSSQPKCISMKILILTFM